MTQDKLEKQIQISAFYPRLGPAQRWAHVCVHPSAWMLLLSEHLLWDFLIPNCTMKQALAVESPGGRINLPISFQHQHDHMLHAACPGNDAAVPLYLYQNVGQLWDDRHSL